MPDRLSRLALGLPIALSCSIAMTLAAQTPEDTTGAAAAPDTTENYSAPWRTSYFPYLTGGANDGPVLAARVRYWQPAPYEARFTSNASLTADAGVTARGSRYITGQFRAPGLWKDWRLTVLASADRQARYGFFGLGNDTRYDKDLVDPSQPFFYRVRRTRYRGVAELTRIVRGPFMVAFQGNVEQVRFTSLPGPSVFVGEFPLGELEQNDISGRIALIYDTRDTEYNTHQGLLLEAGDPGGRRGRPIHPPVRHSHGRYLTVREGTVGGVAAGGIGHGRQPDAQRAVLTARLGVRGSGARGRVLAPLVRHRSAHRQRARSSGISKYGTISFRSVISAR